MESFHNTLELSAVPIWMAALCHKEPGVEVTLLAGLVGDEHILVTGMVHNIDTTETVPLSGYMKLLTYK